jgi:hypothetical protein
MTILFRCYDARLHTLPGAPTLKAATHEQLVAHHQRLNQLNADAIAPRFGTEADDDDGFFESACYGVLSQEDYWRQCGLVWSWIDQKPVWVSAADWDLQILPEPERPCVRQFRLSLLGGGQIKVTEDFELSGIPDWPHVTCYEPKLRVQAQTESGLHTHTGIISHGWVCEMATYAVLFPPKTPQEIADRTAATLRLIDAATGDATENFLALLARSERCSCCNRPLKDEVSKLLSIGPDCVKQMRLPHNLKVAGQIMKRRRELLGEDAAL